MTTSPKPQHIAFRTRLLRTLDSLFLPQRRICVPQISRSQALTTRRRQRLAVADGVGFGGGCGVEGHMQDTSLLAFCLCFYLPDLHWTTPHKPSPTNQKTCSSPGRLDDHVQPDAQLSNTQRAPFVHPLVRHFLTRPPPSGHSIFPLHRVFHICLFPCLPIRSQRVCAMRHPPMLPPIKPLWIGHTDDTDALFATYGSTWTRITRGCQAREEGSNAWTRCVYARPGGVELIRRCARYEDRAGLGIRGRWRPHFIERRYRFVIVR